MEERSAVINFRIEPTVKAAFEKIAARNDRTASQMIRDYVRYVIAQDAQENAQRALELHSEAPSKPKKGQRLAEASKQALRGGK